MTKKVLEIEHVELKSVSIRYVYAKKQFSMEKYQRVTRPVMIKHWVFV